MPGGRGRVYFSRPQPHSLPCRRCFAWANFLEPDGSQPGFAPVSQIVIVTDIMISTRRHLEYASGFLELGMMTAAAAELEKIIPSERHTLAVVTVRLEFLMAAKDWANLVALASEFTRLKPDDPQGWIFHAYALRELAQITEAQAVLHQAEPYHGATCGVLHYNLACYACLLGNKTETRRRLALAAALDKSWLDSALDDPDLAAMRGEIRAGKKA